MRSRDQRLRAASVAVFIADLGVLAYGLMAAIAPQMLRAGYESYTGRPWSNLDMLPDTADFILLLFRLLGVFNVAFAVLAVVVSATAFRRGERWAWWTLLFGNLLAYGAPMTYDRIVGEIGVFEMLEYVGLAVILIALGTTAPLHGERHRATLDHGGTGEGK